MLTFFHYNFGFRPPHSVLLDGTFCQAALQNKINMREQLPKYLADSVELFATQCVLNELEQLGKPVGGALHICQQFPVAKCPHKPLRTAAECLAHLARRSRREGRTKYFIATQDDTLLEKLREFGGIPLLSIRHNTILLDKPSEQSKQLAESGGTLANSELEKVRQLRRQELGETEQRRHRKRKAKGPNPLSCKKKKKRPNEEKLKESGKTKKKKKISVEKL